MTDTEKTGSTKRIRAARRNNAECAISLARRRGWYAEDDKETPPTPPATEDDKDKPTPPTSSEDDKTPANDGMVQMTQSALDKIMADRAAQAKRSVLKDAGVENPDDLKVIIEAHNQAEVKRKEAEEANKTELTKKEEQLTASITLQATQAGTIKTLRIANAIMRLAPGKEIPAARFADLLTLMDVSKITITDGKVEDKDVETAIDATLEGRDYLKANATNGRSHGSPPRNPVTPKLPTPNEQPVQRRRNKTSL